MTSGNGVVDRSRCPAPPDAHTPKRRGTPNAYARWGCRCPDAREARRLYLARRRQGRLTPGLVCSIGTSRRLRALSRIGYSLPALSAHLGLSESRVAFLRRAYSERILAAQARVVANLYDQLCMTPAPGDSTLKARGHAVKAGWWAPLDWETVDIDDPTATPGHPEPGPGLDEAAVHLILAGHIPAGPPQRYSAEIREAVARLDVGPEKLTHTQVAERLQIAVRTVERARRAANPLSTPHPPKKATMSSKKRAA